MKGAYRDYYDRWLRLLSRDAWVEEGDFARVLDRRTLEDRIAEGTTIPVSDVSLMVRDGASASVETNGCETGCKGSKAEKVDDSASPFTHRDRPGQVVANVSVQRLLRM